MDKVERRRLQVLVRERRAFKFSNFRFVNPPIRALGMDWPTIEHAYQASKTLELSWRLDIHAAIKPGDAKRIGQKVPKRPNWDSGVKVSVMALLIRQAYTLETKFGRELLESGDEPIVEWNMWHDQIWGRCVCEKCDGQGKNMLGVLLMERRKQLQAQRNQLKGIKINVAG